MGRYIHGEEAHLGDLATVLNLMRISRCQLNGKMVVICKLKSVQTLLGLLLVLIIVLLLLVILLRNNKTPILQFFNLFILLLGQDSGSLKVVYVLGCWIISNCKFN